MDKCSNNHHFGGPELPISTGFKDKRMMVTSNSSNTKCQIFSPTPLYVHVEQMACLKTNILTSYLFQTKPN